MYASLSFGFKESDVWQLRILNLRSLPILQSLGGPWVFVCTRTLKSQTGHRVNYGRTPNWSGPSLWDGNRSVEAEVPWTLMQRIH